MGLPRSAYVREGEEGVYHCFTRCVRRAFLCGFDKATGRDFSHRKAWVVDRLRHLAAGFAIQVCAYAVMESHHHTVLRTRPDLAKLWSDREVAVRWLRLFPQRRKPGQCPPEPQEQHIRALTDAPQRIEQLRKRLCSLSWFMGRLNEHIARAANKEDQVKGRFWESRFKCTALLDDAAIACGMVYVDLNCIRVGLADTPEESDFTSIQQRIRAWQQDRMIAESGSGDAVMPSIQTPYLAGLAADSAQAEPIMGVPDAVDDWLCPIESQAGRRGILSMTTAQYLDLVDRSGRIMRSDKPGAIDPDLAPILARLGARPDSWVDTISGFGSRFRLAAGTPASLRSFAERLGRRWFQGAAAARAAFCSALQEA